MFSAPVDIIGILSGELVYGINYCETASTEKSSRLYIICIMILNPASQF